MPWRSLSSISSNSPFLSLVSMKPRSSSDSVSLLEVLAIFLTFRSITLPFLSVFYFTTDFWRGVSKNEVSTWCVSRRRWLKVVRALTVAYMSLNFFKWLYISMSLVTWSIPSCTILLNFVLEQVHHLTDDSMAKITLSQQPWVILTLRFIEFLASLSSSSLRRSFSFDLLIGFLPLLGSTLNNPWIISRCINQGINKEKM